MRILTPKTLTISIWILALVLVASLRLLHTCNTITEVSTQAKDILFFDESSHKQKINVDKIFYQLEFKGQTFYVVTYYWCHYAIVASGPSAAIFSADGNFVDGIFDTGEGYYVEQEWDNFKGMKEMKPQEVKALFDRLKKEKKSQM